MQPELAAYRGHGDLLAAGLHRLRRCANLPLHLQADDGMLGVDNGSQPLGALEDDASSPEHPGHPDDGDSLARLAELTARSPHFIDGRLGIARRLDLGCSRKGPTEPPLSASPRRMPPGPNPRCP